MSFVTFRDSTIREGIETPGLYLSLDEKLEIVKKVEQIGIKEIEIQLPNNIKDTIEIGSKIKETGLKLITTGFLFQWLPMEVLEKQLNELNKVIDKFIITIPGSKPHIAMRKVDISEIIKKVKQIIEYLNKYNIKFELGIMDAFQSTDTDFYNIIFELKDFVNHYVLYDTTGTGTPELFELKVKRLRDIHPSSRILVHAHNDFGLATINTIRGIKAGANGADTVLIGLGDRGGNASFEEVVVGLDKLYSVNTGINLSNIYKTCVETAEIFNFSIPPLKPIIGKNTFCHETDLHIDSIFTDNKRAFEPFDPASIGNRRSFIFSDSTYKNSLESILKFYRKEVNKISIENLYKKLNLLSLEKGSIDEKDIFEIVNSI